jgi:hypothetical protein
LICVRLAGWRVARPAIKGGMMRNLFSLTA